jgi:hypothetical protein
MAGGYYLGQQKADSRQQARIGGLLSAVGWPLSGVDSRITTEA